MFRAYSRQLVALLSILFASLVAARGAPQVLWTNVDPDGTACGDPPAPQVLLYVPTGGSTMERWYCDTVSNLWEEDTSGGGGGTPGGSDTHVQYNSSGAFAGEAAFTYTAGTDTLVVGVADVTTSADIARLSFGEFDEIADIASDNVGFIRAATGADFAANGDLIIVPRQGAATDVEFWTGTPAATMRMEIQGDGDFRVVNLASCDTIDTDGNGVMACGTDDDVPESGDFGNAADLESTGALSIDVVAPAEMADADHGDFTYASGVADLDASVVGPTELNEAANYAYTGTNTHAGENTFSDFLTIEQGIRHDWDGDNSYEQYDAYDFDADGTLEMSDLDSIIDAICPSGTCAESGVTLNVYGGDWAAPTADINTDGLIELPSNFTLQCHAGAILNGCDVADVGTCPNAIIAINGRDKVRVDGCHLRGGATDGGGDNVASITGAPMGIHTLNNGATRSTNIWYTNNFAERMLHSCFYAKNVDGLIIQGNIADQCGTWDNLGAWSQPCYYIFATGGVVAENFVVSNNVAKRCEANAINFRIDSRSAGDVIRNGFGVGNVIDQVQDGQYAFNLGGVENVAFYDTVARQSLGILAPNTNDTTNGAEYGSYTGWHNGAGNAATLTDTMGHFDDDNVGDTINNLTDGSSCTISSITDTTVTCTLLADDGTCDTEDCDWDVDDEYSMSGLDNDRATIDAVVDGFTLTDPSGDGTNEALILVGDYHSGLELRNIVIHGDPGNANQDGAYFGQPARGVNVSRLRIEEVADIGIQIGEDTANANAGNEGSTEYIRFRGLEILDSQGYTIIPSNGAAVTNIHFDGFYFRAGNSSANGTVRFDSQVGTNLSWKNGVVDCADILQDGFRFQGDHTELVMESIDFIDCENRHGISFEGTGIECDECMFSRISARADKATNFQGALDLNGAQGSDNLWVSDVRCEGTTSDCVTGLPTSGSIWVTSAEGENAIQEGYQIGAGGPQWTSGTTPPATCTAGDLFTDTDGDGTTNCGGATTACYFAVCRVSNSWYYPAD